MYYGSIWEGGPVKFMPWKHKDLSLGPQHLYKSQAWWYTSVSLVLKKVGTLGVGTQWPPSQSCSVPGSVRRPASKDKGERQRSTEWPLASTSASICSTYTTHTLYIQRRKEIGSIEIFLYNYLFYFSLCSSFLFQTFLFYTFGIVIFLRFLEGLSYILNGLDCFQSPCNFFFSLFDKKCSIKWVIKHLPYNHSIL